MKSIIIDKTSMTPIYEQICRQIRQMLKEQSLAPGDPLPSVRQLAKEQKISALTVKKAYDLLEEEGLVSTVAGKGSFVSELSSSRLEDEILQDLEGQMEAVIRQAKSQGIEKKQLDELYELLKGEIYG